MSNEIIIQGSGENFYTFAKILSLPKGNNNLFPYRKLAVKNGSIYARQLSSDNVVYSQVVVTPVNEPFLTVTGEGDIMMDMTKALANLGILRAFKSVTVKHNPETHTTTYTATSETGHVIEWQVAEPTVEINDGANGSNPILYVPCKCGGTCNECNGTGAVPAPSLSYTNDPKPVHYNVSGCAYNPEDVRLEIECSELKSIGDRTEKMFDQFPITFAENRLNINIGNPEDIASDKFKEELPVQYVKNTSPGFRVVIGEYYKNIFGNLTGKINLFTQRLPPEEASVYTSMNIPGLHTGILIGGVKENQ